jgi:lipoprotein-releasing system permease protein
LIIIGVAAGVAVVTYISALIGGLQRNTLEKTLGAQAHIDLGTDDTTTTTKPSNTTTLQQVQPRTQRPRAIANWQARPPDVKEAMPAWRQYHHGECRPSAAG